MQLKALLVMETLNMPLVQRHSVYKSLYKKAIAARNVQTKQMYKAANEERLMLWGAGNRLS